MSEYNQLAQQLIKVMYKDEPNFSDKFPGRVGTALQHLKRLESMRQQSGSGATARWTLEVLRQLTSMASETQPWNGSTPSTQSAITPPQPQNPRQLALHKAAAYYQSRHPELSFKAALRVVTERVQNRYDMGDFSEMEAIAMAGDD